VNIWDYIVVVFLCCWSLFVFAVMKSMMMMMLKRMFLVWVGHYEFTGERRSWVLSWNKVNKTGLVMIWYWHGMWEQAGFFLETKQKWKWLWLWWRGCNMLIIFGFYLLCLWMMMCWIIVWLNLNHLYEMAVLLANQFNILTHILLYSFRIRRTGFIIHFNTNHI